MGQAGGPKRLPLFLFGLGIVLVVDLQGLPLYNIKQQGMSHVFPQKALSGHVPLNMDRCHLAQLKIAGIR
jgi:hypothetical protein